MDFTCKARCILNGHKSPDPRGGSTYDVVVSREIVCIVFTYTDLNGTNVFDANIRNTYLQSP